MRCLPSVIFMCAVMFVGSASYANELWRCPGNVYTNELTEMQKKAGRCQPVDVDVSVITAPGSTGAAGYGGSASGNDARPVQSSVPAQHPVQRDTRRVQVQIDQAVNALNALEDEYKNGEPERMGPEFRNYQMYLDRVERLKNEIAAKKQEIAMLRSQL